METAREKAARISRTLWLIRRQKWSLDVAHYQHTHPNIKTNQYIDSDGNLVNSSDVQQGMNYQWLGEDVLEYERSHPLSMVAAWITIQHCKHPEFNIGSPTYDVQTGNRNVGIDEAGIRRLEEELTGVCEAAHIDADELRQLEAIPADARLTDAEPIPATLRIPTGPLPGLPTVEWLFGVE